MRKFLPIGLITALYLLLGAFYVVRTPAWQAPDEPAHYNYIRQLADGRLPVMELGDYDETYRNEVVSSRFDPQYDISVITYEDWQPPLYYLLLTPVFVLAQGSLLGLRLTSLLLGAGVIIIAYGIARLLFPQQAWIAWTTAVLVAFLPQHLAIMGSVNNDALAELLIAIILLLLLQWLRPDERTESLLYPVLIGVCLGLGFLTKGTVYLMAPVVAAAALWRYWREWRLLLRAGVAIFLPALFLGSLWWIRNLVVYGGIDIIGKFRHDEVVIGQIRTVEWIAQFGLLGTMDRFLQTTFNSFWGQFGWMALPLPGWIYQPLLLLTGVAVLGLLLLWLRRDHFAGWPLLSGAWLLLVLLFVLTAGLHVGYNVTFVQHQGRYLFPALIPISLGLAAGLGFWGLLLTRPFSSRSPHLIYLLPLCLGLALILLNLYTLIRFIPLLAF